MTHDHPHDHDAPVLWLTHAQLDLICHVHDWTLNRSGEPVTINGKRVVVIDRFFTNEPEGTLPPAPSAPPTRRQGPDWKDEVA